MKTISDIIFNNTLYQQFEHLSTILYDMVGTHIAIPLPHAHLMQFIHPFTNTTKCKNHIDTNNGKSITLFVYGDNIERLITPSYLRNTSQLQKIKIFCSSKSDQEFYTTWTQRYRDKIEKPILHEQLDVYLLTSGYELIQQTRNEPIVTDRLLNLLEKDYEKIREALSINFSQLENDQDAIIKQSEEAQT